MTEKTSNEPIADRAPASDALGELIRTAGRRPLPRPEDVERVRSASRRAWQAAVRVRRRRRRIALAAAAAVAAVAAIGFASVIGLQPPRAATVAVVEGRVEVQRAGAHRWAPLTEDSEPIPAGTRVRTAANGRAAFDLGGISVRVDSDSRLRFPSNTQIRLQAGTVYVDSGRDDRRNGLVIETPFGRVKDVGTQFEVRALTDGLRLRVREGSVNLRRSAQGANVKAVAGEQLLVERSGPVQRRNIAPDAPAWRWAEALAAPLRIDGQSAYDVLRWAARESGRRLVFADPDAELRARGATLSGGRKMKLMPAQAVRIAVATSGDLQASFGDGTLVVRSR